MRQIIIFCEAYGQQNFVLQLAMQNYHDHSVTIVIPMFPNLFMFFDIVNRKVFDGKLNLVYIEPFQSRRIKTKGINRMLSILPDVIKERNYLKEVWEKHFGELLGCDIYFCSRGFNGITFYLLSKLTKNNRLIYVSVASFAPSCWSEYTPRNVTEVASLIILRLTYGSNVMLGQLPYYKGFFYMPDKFIEEVDKVMGKVEINKMMDGFDLSPYRMFDVDNYSVLFFSQPLLNAGYIPDGDAYKQELVAVFTILGKYFPSYKIGMKCHSEYDSSERLVNCDNILPTFVPAELLYNDSVKLYLTIFSHGVSGVEKGLVVSIIDLISFKSEKIKEKLKDDLIQASKSIILFPKTLDEFERMLIDLKTGVV